MVHRDWRCAVLAWASWGPKVEGGGTMTTTKKPITKAFGYGEDPAKKATKKASSPTTTLRETLNKLDIPSTKKVK